MQAQHPRRFLLQRRTPQGLNPPLGLTRPPQAFIVSVCPSADPRGKPLAQEPLVCCGRLTRNRPDMAACALRAFRKQTYRRASIIALDTGDGDGLDCQYYHMPKWAGRSIGELRNEVNSLASSADIIAHWDSDDWSNCNRLSEQVALLQSGDYDCVGYREILFWDCRGWVGKRDWNDPRLEATAENPYADHGESVAGHVNEAWLYTHPKPDYCLGTSLCYWTRAWESKPFPDLPDPKNPNSACEDFVWQSGLRCKSVSAIGEDGEPRMIATVHGGNARSVISPGNCFTRAANWDNRIRAILESA